MASFVFPLAVKILLAQASKYRLLDSDMNHLEVIDLLLNQTDWAGRSGNHTKWSETIHEHMMNRSLDRAFQQAWDTIQRTENEDGGK
jgi:hypothetical protein